MKNSIGWAFTWLLLLSGVAIGADEPPYKLTAQADHYRPDYNSTYVIAGRLVFSQYAASGNAFDIVSLDPATLESTVLISERKGARLIANDERFVVIQQEGDVARAVVVLDAASGQELGRVRLIQPVGWGRIDGERLLLVQGSRAGGYGAEAPALAYSLPDLKLIQSTRITGGNGTLSWKDAIVSLGRELTLYDANFERLGTIPLPLAAVRSNNSCGRRLQLVIGDQAFLTNGCGQINIVDLGSRALVRAIEGPSNFYYLQVIGDLLFAGHADDATSPEVRAYDPTSGDLVAQLPIDASSGMYAVDGRLIALHHTEDSHSRYSLQSFEIDAASLRKGEWQTGRVTAGCIEAQSVLAQSDDLYRAIELCRDSGIDRLIGARDLTPPLRTLVLNYASWLSRTLDRADEAQRILKWLAETGTPLSSLADAQLNAAVHRKVMQNVTHRAAALEAKELDTSLARMIVPNAHSLSTTINLDYGAHSLVMDGNVAYAKRIACEGPCETNGPALMIYDRASMTQVAAIALPISSDDGESERSMSAIAADEQHIYVGVEDHWDIPKSENLLVIDKQTRQVARQVLVPVKAQSVQVIDDTLVVCNCSYQRCLGADRHSFEFVPRTFFSCPNVESFDSASTPLARVPGSSGRWRFTRLNDARSTEIDMGQSIGPVLNEAATAAVFLSMRMSGWSLIHVNLQDGETRTLSMLPRTDAMPVLTIHDATLMVGFQRDLLLFDLRTLKLRRYLQDLIPGGFKDNGNGVDLSKITELRVDEDRLIVKTFSGANSTVVRLDKVLQ
jgi:hypothetical protein